MKKNILDKDLSAVNQDNLIEIQDLAEYYPIKELLDSKLSKIAQEAELEYQEEALKFLSEALYEINSSNFDSFGAILKDTAKIQSLLEEYAISSATQALGFNYAITSQATYDTIYMVFFSIIFAIIFGLPLGVLLSITKSTRILSLPSLNAILGVCVNVVRSFPFIILIILLLPLSQFIVGSSIGSTAAIVPLGIAAIPFIARLFEGALEEVDKGLIEATLSMGASKLRVVVMMIAEAKPGIINAITITIIGLIGYSAMAGAVGAGGLGDVAIRLGFQGYQGDILLSTVVVIIVLVQLVQLIGDLIVAAVRKNR